MQLVGLPPLEPKRKRENVGDMDLRPGALLGPGYGLGNCNLPWESGLKS